MLRRGRPWISAAGEIRVVGRVVHGGNEGSGSGRQLLLAIEDGAGRRVMSTAALARPLSAIGEGAN